MKLAVRTPLELLVEADDVQRIAAETDDGAFAVAPRHMDFVTTVAPGILSYTVAGDERPLAVDRGILVKCGSEVLVSVRDAVCGDAVGELERALREHLLARDERERHAISALARLESGVVRAFVDIDWSGHG